MRVLVVAPHDGAHVAPAIGAALGAFGCQCCWLVGTDKLTTRIVERVRPDLAIGTVGSTMAFVKAMCEAGLSTADHHGGGVVAPVVMVYGPGDSGLDVAERYLRGEGLPAQIAGAVGDAESLFDALERFERA